MPRANSSVPRHRRHRKIVKQAKGYYGARSRTFKQQKMQSSKQGYMRTEIDVKENVNFEDCGFCELMLRSGSMAYPILLLFLD